MTAERPRQTARGECPAREARPGPRKPRTGHAPPAPALAARVTLTPRMPPHLWGPRPAPQQPPRQRRLWGHTGPGTSEPRASRAGRGAGRWAARPGRATKEGPLRGTPVPANAERGRRPVRRPPEFPSRFSSQKQMKEAERRTAANPGDATLVSSNSGKDSARGGSAFQAALRMAPASVRMARIRQRRAAGPPAPVLGVPTPRRAAGPPAPAGRARPGPLGAPRKPAGQETWVSRARSAGQGGSMPPEVRAGPRGGYQPPPQRDRVRGPEAVNHAHTAEPGQPHAPARCGPGRPGAGSHTSPGARGEADRGHGRCPGRVAAGAWGRVPWESPGRCWLGTARLGSVPPSACAWPMASPSRSLSFPAAKEGRGQPGRV